MSDSKSRIEKLEDHMQSYAKSFVWVDLFDTRVRIDINYQRGEEMTFETVRECIDWTQKQIEKFEKVGGIAYIDDISHLFAEGMPRDMFNKIHEGAINKNVVIALNELYGRSIASVAFITWWYLISRNEEWRKEVLARADAISESLDDGEEEDEITDTE